MRIRLVIDLTYPTASTSDEEELIKHRLSAQVMAAARAKQYNVLALDEQEEIEVGEVMVGCARVEEPDTSTGAAETVATAAVGVPEEKATHGGLVAGRRGPPMGQAGKINPETLEPNVYGGEDGDYWYASGHLNVADMMEAVIKWEKEVSDDLLGADDIDIDSHGTYYVVEDPDNSERYKVVGEDYPEAQPMTQIRRRAR